MPNNASAARAFWGFATLTHTHGAQGLGHGFVGSEILMIARHLFDGLVALRFKENKEAYNVQKSAWVKDATNQRFQSRTTLFQACAIYTAPGLEPLKISGQCAYTRVGTVGNDQ